MPAAASAELQRHLAWRLHVTERTPALLLDCDSKTRSEEEAFRPPLRPTTPQQPAPCTMLPVATSIPPGQHCYIGGVLPGAVASDAIVEKGIQRSCAPMVGTGIRVVETYGAGRSLQQQQQQHGQRQQRSQRQPWDWCESAKLRTLNAGLQERLQAAEQAVKAQKVHIEVLQRETISVVEQQQRAILLELRPGLEALESSAAELLRHINGDMGPSDSTERPDLFLRSSALRLQEQVKDLAAKSSMRLAKIPPREAGSIAVPAAPPQAASPLPPSGEERVEDPMLAQVEPTERIAGTQDAEIETCIEAAGDADMKLSLQDVTQGVGPTGTTEDVFDRCLLDEQPALPLTPAWTARDETDCVVIEPEAPSCETGPVPDCQAWPQSCSLCARPGSCEPKSRPHERGSAARTARSSSCPRPPRGGSCRRQCCPGSQVMTLADRVQKEPLAKPALPRWGRQKSCSAQTTSSMARRGKRASRQALKTEQTSSACEDAAVPGSLVLPNDRRSCKGRKTNCASAASRP